MSASSPLIDAVVAAHPDAVISSHRYRGDDTVVLTGASMHAVAKFLKEDAATRMNVLMDLTAVDYSAFGQGPMPAFFTSSGVGVRPLRQIPDQDPWPGPPGGGRFVVVHHLFSTTLKHRLRLVTPVDDGTLTVDTVSDLWPGANWLEREVWDMFGIEFAGHPDLRRLLMYDEFVGHPLRKDYPVKKRQPLIGPVN